jgi:hypothetical protein
MSGLEAIPITFGIITVITQAMSWFKNWRKERRERKENARNKRLKKSLVICRTDIQREFDRCFARLGQRFAVGDGKLQYND